MCAHFQMGCDLVRQHYLQLSVHTTHKINLSMLYIYIQREKAIEISCFSDIPADIPAETQRKTHTGCNRGTK